MGLAVGTETYYQYLKSFGLMDKTGVDMIGEAKGIFVDEDYFNSQVVSLASYSFGQTFNVTPIELIRAQAACVNGGYLYEPYIVEQVLDDDGNRSLPARLHPHPAGDQRGDLRHRAGGAGICGVLRQRPQRPGGGLPHRRQDRYGG